MARFVCSGSNLRIQIIAVGQGNSLVRNKLHRNRSPRIPSGNVKNLAPIGLLAPSILPQMRFNFLSVKLSICQREIISRRAVIRHRNSNAVQISFVIEPALLHKLFVFRIGRCVSRCAGAQRRHRFQNCRPAEFLDVYINHSRRIGRQRAQQTLPRIPLRRELRVAEVSSR